MSKTKLNTLIKDLSEDLQPQNRMLSPLSKLAIWGAISTIAVAVFIYYIGLRPDIAQKLQSADFVTEIMLTSALGLSAGLSAFLLCLPDKGGRGWFLVIPLTLFAVLTLSALIKILFNGLVMPEIGLTHCVEEAGLFVIIPASLITFMTMHKNATTNPVLLTTMNALAAGSIGYLSMRLSCMMDTIGHNLVYHFAPYLILGMILGLIARRLYRW